MHNAELLSSIFNVLSLVGAYFELKSPTALDFLGPAQISGLWLGVPKDMLQQDFCLEFEGEKVLLDQH